MRFARSAIQSRDFRRRRANVFHGGSAPFGEVDDRRGALGPLEILEQGDRAVSVLGASSPSQGGPVQQSFRQVPFG